MFCANFGVWKAYGLRMGSIHMNAAIRPVNAAHAGGVLRKWSGGGVQSWLNSLGAKGNLQPNGKAAGQSGYRYNGVDVRCQP